ncbi:MAG: GYF domain-containing protein [Terrimicrobiaceae bacterium]|nr:GYF domain-containing protein [Terrimicrobiaceae bacterium]
MSAKAYFYSINGTVEGPHSPGEIVDLLLDGVLHQSVHLIASGDPDWKTVSDFREVVELLERRKVPAEDLSGGPVSTIEATAEERAEISAEQEEIKAKRKTRHAMLRTIRSSLDALWEAQREAIIARIKDDDLDVEYESTRKGHKALYQEIEQNVFEYWRAEGILSSWVRDLTWNDADFTLKFKSKDEGGKFDEAMAWLAAKNLIGLPAVYCFICGKEYVYVGQAKEIGSRLKQHEQKTFFTRADRLRVVIPQNKKMLNKLERLIILNRQPTENRSPGIMKNNPADDCMEFIRREIKELISDF